MTAFDRRQVIEDAARAMHNTAGQWPCPWERLSTEEPGWAEGWRDNAKAALPVIVAVVLKPIRELHYPADNDAARTPRCPECLGKAGVHPCGCWADEDQQIEADSKGGA